MIELKEIRKGYNGEPVLKGISLTVHDGDYLSLMGRSGSGKSTLLSIVGGFLPPDSGSVSWDGEDVYAMTDTRMAWMRCHRVGFVFQNFKLINTLSVRDNILLPASMSDLAEKTVRENLKKYCDALDIAALLDKYPDELSGGQQQRAAICRALCFEPSLLILDEPTGALDSENEKKVMFLLRSVNEERKTTMIQVTHSTTVAANAARVLQMTDGRLV